MNITIPIFDQSVEGSGPMTLEQCEVLRRAVGKIVVFGEQVGVSAEQMIGLLESGLTVRELLVYLTSRGAFAA